MIIVNCLGLLCPLPLVKTKEAMSKNIKDVDIEVIMDNEISFINVKRFLSESHIPFLDSTLNDSKTKSYHIVFQNQKVKPSELKKSTPSNLLTINNSVSTVFTVVINSEFMGIGEEKLGTQLMNAYLETLAISEDIPSTIIFYNSGVKLFGDNILKPTMVKLRARDIKLWCCGVCCEFYNMGSFIPKEELTNMLSIIDIINQSSKVFQP